MKFYMTPGSCSTGIHILLEEIGLVFEAYIVNLVKGDHLRPEYLAINPNGTIPTLVRDDGVALTDFVAIATWLAEAYPRRNCRRKIRSWPKRRRRRLKFCTLHIHGEGFRRVFTPGAIRVEATDNRQVKAQGREIVLKAFEAVNDELAGKDYVAGAFLHRRRGAFLCRVLG